MEAPAGSRGMSCTTGLTAWGQEAGSPVRSVAHVCRSVIRRNALEPGRKPGCVGAPEGTWMEVELSTPPQSESPEK